MEVLYDDLNENKQFPKVGRCKANKRKLEILGGWEIERNKIVSW